MVKCYEETEVKKPQVEVVSSVLKVIENEFCQK